MKQKFISLPTLRLLAAMTATLTLLLTGCGDNSGGGPAGGMAIPVLAAEAKRQLVTERLSLVGTLQANEAVTIRSEIEGLVLETGFQEGQAVGQGTLLFRLDDTKLAAALAEAESNFKLSETSYARSKQLYTERLISQQEYDEAAARFSANQATLERRRRELKDTRIYAPFDGIAGARLVSAGQVIAPATVLTTLVDLDPIKAEVSIPERFLGQVKLGQDFQLTVAAFPDRTFSGQAYFIAPDIDPATRTALVKARVPNPDALLKAGMFANLELTLQVRENAIVIPESALLLTQKKSTVWLIGADDSVQSQEVTVGLRIPGLAEITAGLQPGDRVVTEGWQKLMPGAKVAIANAPATNPPTAGSPTTSLPTAGPGPGPGQTNQAK